MKVEKQPQFIGLIILYTLVLFLSNDAYLPALPSVMKDLSASYHSTQLSLTVWFLGSACIQLFLGPVSDKYGRRPVILMGALIFVFSSILCALSTHITIFLIARLFQGASVASMLVAGYACIHEHFHSEKAVKVLGKMNSVTVLAPAVGPLLGALLLSIVSWRGIFVLLGLGALFCLLGLTFKLPETIQEKHPLHLMTLLKQYKKIMTNGQFFLNSLSYCALFSGLIVWITAGPFIVVDLFKLSTMYFAIYQGIIFGFFILGSLSLRLEIVMKYRATLIKLLHLIILVASSTAVALNYYFPHSLSGLIVPLCFYAFCGGILMPVLSRAAIDSCRSPMGAVIAVQATMLSTFGVIGSAAVGYFYHHTLLSVTCIIFILAVLAFMRVCSVPYKKSYEYLLLSYFQKVKAFFNTFFI